MQCARLGSFSGKVGPGGPMGDRSERAVCGVASACKLKKLFQSEMSGPPETNVGIGG